MPIRVEHGGPGLAGLAGLLGGVGQRAISQRAQAEQNARQQRQLQAQGQITAANNAARRSMQAASINAQRSNSQQQIQAQSHRQSQAADQAYKRMFVQAGLQEEFQQQAYDREVQKMEEQARQRASERKMVYSEEGKRRMAEWNRAKEYALDPESDMGRMDSPERKALLQRAEMGAAGIPQHSIPAPGPKPPEGFAPYESGTLPNGMGYLVGHDGKVLTQPYEHTKVGYEAVQRMKQKDAQEKEEQAFEAKRQSMIQALIGKKYSKQIPGTSSEEAHADPDAIHTLESATRQVNLTHPPSERNQRADLSAAAGMIPGLSQRPSAAPAAPQQQQVPSPQRGASGWQNSPAAENLIIYESDLEVPAQVGYSIAYMRTVLRNFGPKKELWLKETKNNFEKAREIVQDFQRPALGTR